MSISEVANQVSQPFSLPNLPYDKSAFGDLLSPESFDFHHAKHHNTYVVNLNKAIDGNADYSGLTLEEIIQKSNGKDAGVFNNSAQIWNHSFFWNCLSPNPQKPGAKLIALIERDFGSFDSFRTEFLQAGATQFGSGWAWLVQNKDGALSVVKTPNANTPITDGLNPLLTCDVWEHAYYIDYRNKRPDFLATFIDQLANWEFAESRLA